MTTSRFVQSPCAVSRAAVSGPRARRTGSSEPVVSLRYLAMKHVTLAPGAVREPYWKEEASELVICLSGQIRVSALGKGDMCESIVIASGVMLHIAAPALQKIENLGDTLAEFIVITSFEDPRTLSLYRAFKAMSAGAKPNRSQYSDKDAKPYGGDRSQEAYELSGKLRASDSARNSFEDRASTGFFAGCSIRLVSPAFQSVIGDLSGRALQAAQSTAREARSWPDHVAMAYIHKGRTRLSVLDGSGEVSTYEFDPGTRPDRLRRAPATETGPAVVNRPPIIIFEQPMLADAFYRSATCTLTGTILSALCDLDDSAFHLPSCDSPQIVAVRWVDIAG